MIGYMSSSRRFKKFSNGNTKAPNKYASCLVVHMHGNPVVSVVPLFDRLMSRGIRARFFTYPELYVRPRNRFAYCNVVRGCFRACSGKERQRVCVSTEEAHALRARRHVSAAHVCQQKRSPLLPRCVDSRERWAPVYRRRSRPWPRTKAATHDQQRRVTSAAERDASLANLTVLARFQGPRGRLARVQSSTAVCCGRRHVELARRLRRFQQATHISNRWSPEGCRCGNCDRRK